MTSVATNKIWYLSGPMTGHPLFNFPAFKEAAHTLRNRFRLDVRSAHEIDHGEHTGTGSQPYVEYLRKDISVLLECSGIIMLQGWTESNGAQVEFYLACKLNYPAYQYSQSKYGAQLVPMSSPEKFDDQPS